MDHIKEFSLNQMGDWDLEKSWADICDEEYEKHRKEQEQETQKQENGQETQEQENGQEHHENPQEIDTEGFQTVSKKKKSHRKPYGKKLLKNRYIICRFCKKSFVFTPNEQIKFSSRKWTDPKSCKNCKKQ